MYKNSKKRLLLLLTQLVILMYTFNNGDEEARLLAMLVSPLWIIAALSWRKHD